MSASKNKPTASTQKTVEETFSKKRTTVDSLIGSDKSKRKKGSSDDSLTNSVDKVLDGLQAFASAQSYKNSLANSPHADCADASSLGDITDAAITDGPSCADNADCSPSRADISDSSSHADRVACASHADSAAGSILESGQMLKMLETEPHAEQNNRVSPSLVRTVDYVVSDLSSNPYHAPVQPKLASFPKTLSRRFNGDYLSYPWIEYSVVQDAIYCFACRHFQLPSTGGGGGRERGNIPFVDIGFCKWVKTGRALKKHEESKKHKSSVVSWANFERERLLTGFQLPIAPRRVKVQDHEIKVDRRHMEHLLKTVCLLGRQGIPFRGRFDLKDSQNKGNFIEILEFLSNDEKLKEEMAKRYDDYTSTEYINDMISVVATLVRENIVKKVKKFFALLVNEMEDFDHKEQLTFVIRFLDQDGNVQEKPIGCYHMEQLDAASVAASIDDSIGKAGLDWKNCVSQSYDGSSLMSGCFNGVQAKIQQIAPQAPYMHCSIHALSLTLVQSIGSIQPVKLFFSTLQAVYAFLSESAFRHDLFVKAQTESGLQVLELERLTGNGWHYSYTTVKKIQMRFELIIVVLRVISQYDKESGLEAKHILHNLQSFSFILTMLSMEVFLRKVQPLSEELQRKDLDLSKACVLIKSTRNELVRLRQDREWAKLVNEATQLAEQCDIEIEEPEPRALPLRHHLLVNQLTEYYIRMIVGDESNHYEDSEDGIPLPECLQQEMYLSSLDRFVNEIDARFTDNMGILTAISMFNPKAANFLDYSSAQVFVEKFPAAGINLVILDAQLDTAKAYLSTKDLQDIHSVRQHLEGLKQAFSEVLELLHIVLVLPVTPASKEGFFPCLERVKHYLRNNCGDERLGDLMVMACEHAEVKNLNVKVAVDRFEEMGY